MRTTAPAKRERYIIYTSRVFSRFLFVSFCSFRVRVYILYGYISTRFLRRKMRGKNKKIIADMTNREDRRKMWSVPNRRRLSRVSAAKTLFSMVSFSVRLRPANVPARSLFDINRRRRWCDVKTTIREQLSSTIANASPTSRSPFMHNRMGTTLDLKFDSNL